MNEMRMIDWGFGRIEQNEERNEWDEEDRSEDWEGKRRREEDWENSGEDGKGIEYRRV